MGYRALYRVWRPQRFSDMAGQTHITRTLQNALMNEKFSHAYLFTGPRGTGKTSVAKIVAKAVNCEKAPAPEPCNECAVCRGITDGSLSDVIEIDAASNNGVDEIREIRENVKYAPSVARYKVYIVDEVHMLSQGAFNALLKTLEEPPSHVIFILATTEPHKIPPTIISRCQRFDFKRISLDAIQERLNYIVHEQGIEMDEKASALIAKASEGGMRDALSILDQAAAYGNGAVTEDIVLEVTGMVSERMLSEIVRSTLDRDVAKAIRAIDEIVKAGKDPERFMEDLIFYYRDLMLYKASPELEEIRDKTLTDESFAQIAERIEAERIHESIHILSDLQQEMKRTGHPRVFLEIAMVKLCQIEEKSAGPASADIVRRLEALEERLNRLEVSPDAVQTVNRGDKRAVGPSPKRKTVKIAEGALQTVLDEAVKDELKELQSRWPAIMEKIRKTHIAAHAWLLESYPVASSPDAFIQAFKYDFHCQMVAENKNNAMQIVEDVVFEATGKRKKMYPVPQKQWDEVRAAYIKNMEARGERPEQPGNHNKNPLIAEAEKLVGPDLLEIKD
ncbi:DNA polymerase III subunit gamma/tau [Caenibacillus caldisaponilyticus]|uniref:DNA polymerase III subunit gamma/tau n=1 Tax=Caenibacillus caldisaponilyticus TaxID=1674942 RepID=UPI0009884F7A|nr:DNA polymerase III subunit gamma/tau [Caenibacillus caldisaponilyticus]